MKIMIGQIAHETNTFSTEKTTIDNFKLWEWDIGDVIIEKHKHVKDYLGGMITKGEALGVELIPSFSALAYPSGVITKETYEEMKTNLLTCVARENIDALCLNMHGAGVAEGIEDLEGTLLSEVRRVIGYAVPLVVTLDLHANVSDLMVKEADLLLGVNFYPHTDSYERGMEAMDLAVKLIKKEYHPVMHLTKIPLMIPTSTTNFSPAKDINERCWGWEKESEVIDCTFYHGFPYTDVRDVGVSILTTTNNNQALAEKISTEVASQVLDLKDAFFPRTLSPEEGLQVASHLEQKAIVINETSDNPGGGTPGDGTFLLQKMIDMKVQDACFAYICDKEVAELAHQAGVGLTIDISLGGKTDSLHGTPIVAKAYIKSLTDGKFVYSSPMWGGLQVDLGKSARLQINGIDVIVCSVKSQVLDEQIFLLHGIDVTNYKMIGLKSSQHFRAAFEPISNRIITVDSPGLTTLNFSVFDYRNVKRPIYPLDSIITIN